MKIKKRRLFSILLSIALMLGLMPVMRSTAYAATDTYTALMNNAAVVEFNGYNWYIIEDDSTRVTGGTVTLLAADDSFGLSVFSNVSDLLYGIYGYSVIRTALDEMTSRGAFKDVADAIADTDLSDVSVTGAKLYLLDTATAKSLHQDILRFSFPNAFHGGWWLRTIGSGPYDAACVFGAEGRVSDRVYDATQKLGVRPALRLKLSSVIFSSVNLSGGANTVTSGGSTSQYYFDAGSSRSAMTTVTYTAKPGYTFPEKSDHYTETNGITVTRKSDNVLEVYGTPTDAANITVPDAVKATAKITKAPAANPLTYNGAMQDLVTAGKAEGGTMKYALGTNAVTAPEDGWSETIPAGIDIGTYYVWYKAAGDADHSDTDPACVTVTVSEKSAPAPTPSPVASITINTSSVNADTLNAALAQAGGSADSVTTIVLGNKVKKISKGAFRNYRNAKTLVVKSKKLKKKSVKGSLKGSKISKVKVQVGNKKTNKKYVKRYKSIFTKKNAGRKVKVSL